MKRRLKSTRYLPKYVTAFVDRHGKERLRFRRKGYPDHYFKSEFGSNDFAGELIWCNDPQRQVDLVNSNIEKRERYGSVNYLLRQYFSYPERLGPSETTQLKVRRILERWAEDKGDDLIAHFNFLHIDAFISAARKKTVAENGRVSGGIEAARKLRKELARLFKFAVKLKLITTNPVDEAEYVKVAPGEASTGFYAWTEDDISKYRRRWTLGTNQRLAMELLLWTDQRKCDTIHLGRKDQVGQFFTVRQSKGGKTLQIFVAPQLQAAIDAMPPHNGPCFLMNEWSNPFTVAGFGNWFRDACNAAGLPRCTAHGLRKAMLIRMAHLELPNESLKSVSGHVKDDEVALYVRAAQQARLAQAAIIRVSDWESESTSP